MMKPETKARHLKFERNQLKILQEKARKHPHDKKMRGSILRLMNKIEKIEKS